MHKSSLNRSADELNHKILNLYPLKDLLKYMYPRNITVGSLNQSGIHLVYEYAFKNEMEASLKCLCVVVFQTTSLNLLG